MEIDLTESERKLFHAGLNEWAGPASLSDELAYAMGFVNRQDFFEQMPRLREAITSSSELDPFDWARVLVATEFVFASDVFGSGLDWRSSAGIVDEEAIATLRGLQRKILKAGVGARSLLGPTRRGEFRWQYSSATAIRHYRSGRGDLPGLISTLSETVESFSDDLADLRQLLESLQSVSDLPEDEARAAAMTKFEDLQRSVSERLGSDVARRFW